MVATLLPFAKGRFIIGGDWNTALAFDQLDPAGRGAAAELFDRRWNEGWYDAARKFHHEEIRTYFDDRAEIYELDRVFTDADTYAALVACYALDDPATSELSDHAPLVVDVAL